MTNRLGGKHYLLYNRTRLGFRLQTLALPETGNEYSNVPENRG